jgi:hypothetical protein
MISLAVKCFPNLRSVDNGISAEAIVETEHGDISKPSSLGEANRSMGGKPGSYDSYSCLECTKPVLIVRRRVASGIEVHSTLVDRKKNDFASERAFFQCQCLLGGDPFVMLIPSALVNPNNDLAGERAIV